MKHNMLILLLTFPLLGSEVSSATKKLYLVKDTLKGKSEKAIKKQLEHITVFARQNSWDGINIENQVLPFAERFLEYSNTGKNILIFDSIHKEYTTNVHSTLYPLDNEIDASVQSPELNNIQWCATRNVDYTSGLFCISKSTKGIIAAALIDHNFNVNSTRMHTLYTSKNNRRKGCAKELFTKSVRLSIANKCNIFSLYAQSIGEDGYRVSTSILLSFYQKMGLIKQQFDNDMRALSADLGKGILSDPDECVSLIF